jgi:hypothetical protein
MNMDIAESRKIFHTANNYLSIAVFSSLLHLQPELLWITVSAVFTGAIVGAGKDDRSHSDAVINSLARRFSRCWRMPGPGHGAANPQSNDVVTKG